VSIARNVGELVGAWCGTMNPERRSATRDAAQSLAIGVAIVVPLALILRRRTASAAPAIATQGLEVAPTLYRMRY
jgi:hypothetical protein